MSYDKLLTMWFISAFLAALLWGLSYSLDEQILKSHVSTYTLLVLQTFSGGLVFTVIALYLRILKTDLAMIKSDPKLATLIIITIVISNLANYFIVTSIQLKNATYAALLEQSYPLFTVLFSLILFKENVLSPQVLMGGALILIGVVIISIAK